MKRMKIGKVLLTMTLVISTVFIGCGQASDNTQTADATVTVAEEETPQAAAAPEEPVEYNFYFLRHGQTLFNVNDEVVSGWVDSPLTEHGWAVAKTLKEGLKDVEFTGVYTSISERAWDTTNCAVEGRGIVPVINEDLKELYFGSLDGAIGERKKEVWADYDRRLKEGWVDEGGENFEMVADRMQRAVDLAMKEHPEGGNILMGSHGMAILCYVQKYLADDPIYIEWSDGGKNYALPNCSVTVVNVKDGKYTLKMMADTRFIDEDVDQ